MKYTLELLKAAQSSHEESLAKMYSELEEWVSFQFRIGKSKDRFMLYDDNHTYPINKAAPLADCIAFIEENQRDFTTEDFLSLVESQ